MSDEIVLRGHPCLLFVDGNGARPSGVGLVRRLKLDAFTAIVPVTVLAAIIPAVRASRVIHSRAVCAIPFCPATTLTATWRPSTSS